MPVNHIANYIDDVESIEDEVVVELKLQMQEVLIYLLNVVVVNYAGKENVKIVADHDVVMVKAVGMVFIVYGTDVEPNVEVKQVL